MSLGWASPPQSVATATAMRFCSMIVFVLLVLVIYDALKPPLKKGGLKKGGKRALKVIGETGLGVVSLSAALAILNSLEQDTDPADEQMMSLISAERERLMGLGRSAWESPLAWSGGAAGLSALAVILYLIRMIRNRKIKKEKETKETRVIIGSARKDEESGSLQFGDIRMQ